MNPYQSPQLVDAVQQSPLFRMLVRNAVPAIVLAEGCVICAYACSLALHGRIAFAIAEAVMAATLFAACALMSSVGRAKGKNE